MNVYVLEHNLLLFHSCGEKFLSACNFPHISASNYKKHYHADGAQSGDTTIYGNHLWKSLMPTSS